MAILSQIGTVLFVALAAYVPYQLGLLVMLGITASTRFPEMLGFGTFTLLYGVAVYFVLQKLGASLQITLFALLLLNWMWIVGGLVMALSWLMKRLTLREPDADRISLIVADLFATVLGGTMIVVFGRSA